MGLDISAYRQLEATGPINPDYDYGNRVQFYKLSDFGDLAPELDESQLYSFAEDFGFRAGSYSGYNQWRRELAQMAGYASDEAVWDNPQPGPFVELINFSDCEGVLGLGACIKLAKDFADFQAKADAHPDEYFRAKYEDWRKAFEMASDKGAVKFH